MRGRARTARPARAPARHGAGAITWIDARRAIVARRSPGGEVEMKDFELPQDAEGRIRTLADIAATIGATDRVMILGDASLRTLLEREYVAIYRRPDLLIDIEPRGPMTPEDLVARLQDSDS